MNKTRSLLSHPHKGLDFAVGAALAVLYVVILLFTVTNLGYARDEGFYFHAASAYGGWFEHLFRAPSEAIQRNVVDGPWSNNHEHPALVKSVFALSWLFLYKKWHLFAEEGTSFRFGGMLFAGVGLFLLYTWGTRARSRTTGLIAALLFALMPRVFYHAHLDCFDVPITVMWLLCAYCYARALDSGSLAWAIVTGITFGLALDTKHNAWFIPFAFVLHSLIARYRAYREGLRSGMLSIPLPLLCSAILGPVVFYLLWPWLWYDPAARFTEYVKFHLHHDYYNMVFLGETYWKPPSPRGYAWVMTLATVPTIALVLFGVGASQMLFRLRTVPRLSFRIPWPTRGDLTATPWLWALGILTSYMPWIVSTDTPIFGGTKHWMPAYPFLCLFAGAGFDIVAKGLVEYLERSQKARPWQIAGAPAALGLLVVLPPAFETAHSHPFGLSNYTPLVGGAPGGASLGLNRQFWGFTTGVVTDFLNANVKPGQSVYVHDTAMASWDMMVRDGRLKNHIRGTLSIDQSDFALYHHEEHMAGVEYQIWQAYGTSTPAHVGTYDGVPIIYVYQKDRGR